MMRLTASGHSFRECGVSHLIEYLIMTSVILLLILIMMLSVTPVFIDGPLNQLNTYAYNDIGNGMSTRIVDLYIIAPDNTTSENYYILSKFDIPDDVAGKGYYVEILPLKDDPYGSLIISGEVMQTKISLSGISKTIPVSGKTSSSGINTISYPY